MTGARSTAHDTIVLERTYRAAPARVFAAWADVRARQVWSNPSPETDIVYDRHDFRVGGIDVARCGFKHDMRWTAEVHYLDIVTDQRIIFSERITEAGVPAATALISVELRARGKETHQIVTLHVIALDGSDMLAGYVQGWNPALDNIAAWLTGTV